MAFRCVKCSLGIAWLSRHRLSDGSAESLEKVRKWIYPRDVSGADFLCHACWELINSNDEPPHVPVRDHQGVCLTCGRSILRIRSRKVIREGTSEMLIRYVISKWIHPRQLLPSDKVCYPCLLKAKRAANTLSKQSQLVETSTDSSNLLNVDELKIKEEPLDQVWPPCTKDEDFKSEISPGGREMLLYDGNTKTEYL